MITQFLESLGIKTIVFIAGLAGGLASLTKRTKSNWWEKFISVLTGGFTANYLTPLVAEWTNLGENTHYGFAFLLGYGGLASVEMLWNRLHKDDKKEEKPIDNENN